MSIFLSPGKYVKSPSCKPAKPTRGLKVLNKMLHNFSIHVMPQIVICICILYQTRLNLVSTFCPCSQLSFMLLMSCPIAIATDCAFSNANRKRLKSGPIMLVFILFYLFSYMDVCAKVLHHPLLLYILLPRTQFL